MKITILIDNPNSWYIPYTAKLVDKLVDMGHTVFLIHSAKEIPKGDMAFFLSCEKIVKKDIRDRNEWNLVIHSSHLPQGKGWSPLTHQILEGRGVIVSTLFEAIEDVDAGVIYARSNMTFRGDELLEELHAIQGAKVNEMILAFVANPTRGVSQSGEESFYPKRTAKDSELDSHKTIAEQFNLLRVVDNDRYPAFFYHLGKKYVLRITKGED